MMYERTVSPGTHFGFEWRSSFELFGWPLIHVTAGRGKDGRLLVSKGIVAIGQFAVGVVAIAQFGVGFLFGFGQFVAGLYAVGQFAAGVLFGLGQLASGATVIAQFGVGEYVRAMAGIGNHLWTIKTKDPAAVEHFERLWEIAKGYIG